MPFPTVRKQNRFSAINPGKLGRHFWAAHLSDGNDGDKDQKFTLEEAKTKLRDDGWAVMRQDAFNRIIDEKHGEGYNKAKKEIDANGDKLEDAKAIQAENDKLKKKISEIEKDKPDMISKSEHEQIIAAKEAELKKRDDSIAGLRKLQLDNEILKTVGAKAVDADAVLALSRDRFQLGEDGKVFPINEKGEKIIDTDGSYLNTDKYFEKFFKDKPYLAKASGSSGADSSTNGAGSGNATTGGKYTLDQLDSMSDEEFFKTGGLSALSS